MPNYTENPSFNSQRVQKASRINGIESTRLNKHLQILEKEKQNHLRMNSREVRILHLTMEHIKASSGKSPEGIAEDEEFVERKGDIVSCFLYGDRTHSRRFGKFRRIQSAAAMAPRTEAEEDEDVNVDARQGRKMSRERPHTSPTRRSIVWGGRTIPLQDRSKSTQGQASHKYSAPSEPDLDADSVFDRQADDSDEDSDENHPSGPARPFLVDMPRRYRNVSVTGNDPLPVPFSNQDGISIDEEIKDLGETFRHKASMRERAISKKRKSSQVSIVKSEKKTNLAKVVNQARALSMAVSKWRRLGGMPGVEKPMGDQEDDTASDMKKALDNQRRKSLMGKIESFMDQYPITQES